MVPRKPIRPRVPVNVLFGLVVGLLLGICSALVRGILDRSIKTPDDVEQELRIASLGLLPEIADGKATRSNYYGRRRRDRPARLIERPELIVHDFPSSGIAEASRAIRTNLLFMAPDNPYRTLLVTSAGPAEGKTTVASCIAIAMAQAGQRVVLMDCDLRRPRVHRIFGTSSNEGVTTALLDDGADQDPTPTEVPNLWVMPAGPIPPNPAELFHSDRFRELLRRLNADFDRIVIDSPPIVAVTDATVLSTLVDGTVLVIRAFKTTKEVARQALRALEDVGAKTAGGVLNAVDLDRHEYKYYHYYYKRDDYYSSEKPAPAGPSAGAPPTQ